MTLQLALLFAIGLLAAVGLGLIFLAGARGRRLRRRKQRLSGRVAALRARLETYAASGFQDVERLHIELRAADDPQQMDAALRAVGGGLEALEPDVQERLRAVYERSGLLAMHRSSLREAPDWRTRADSALVLGHLGDIEAIPDLAASVRDADEDASTVKAAAARALGMMTAPGAAELLVTELAAPGDWSSPRIAEALVEMGGPAYAATLAGLDHDSANVRAWCSRVLGQLGDPGAVRPLMGRLLDRSGPVRTVAAEALGLLADPTATSSLVEAMLRDPAAQVRGGAARALGRTADPASLSALVDALDDPDPWTRIRAVEALEALHPDDAELLLEAVRSGREESSRAAAVALERIGHVQRWVDQLVDAPRGGVAALEGWLVMVARQGGSGPLRRAMRESAELATRARCAR
ncbi:MAG: HEAT repeat domain-containing protein, partial [Deltaproteobacteria bacterium]|nr:HEAT repeat domain-containing protein [Deltaproteobacteria bacterium]